MTSGWIQTDKEPPHRGDAAEDSFRDACGSCPYRISPVEVEPVSGQTYVKCAVCICPLKIVVHRYGVCPQGRVSPPEIF